jgi:hypothetical protein
VAHILGQKAIDVTIGMICTRISNAYDSMPHLVFVIPDYGLHDGLGGAQDDDRRRLRAAAMWVYPVRGQVLIVPSLKLRMMILKRKPKSSTESSHHTMDLNDE